MKFQYLGVLLGLLWSVCSWAQTTVPIRNYSPKEYDGFTQTWGLGQDSRGIMFFANGYTGNFMEFDGHTWRKIFSKPESTVSVIEAPNKRMFGCIDRGFGYLETQPNGQWKYKSLSDSLPVNDFMDLWETNIVGDDVFFNTHEKYLFVYSQKTNRVKTIYAKNKFSKAWTIDNNLWIRDKDIGLFNYKNDSLVFVKGSEKLANIRVATMTSFAPNQLLLCSNDTGFMIFDYATQELKPWKINFEPLRKKLRMSDCIALKSGLFAISSNNGLVVFDRQGILRHYFNTENGLQASNIYDVKEDREGAVWLVMFKGISKISLNSPVSYRPDGQGFEGCAGMARLNGQLYFVSSGSVYRMAEDFGKPSIDGQKNKMPFTKIEEIPTAQFTDCFVQDKEVWISSYSNSYRIKASGKVERLPVGFASRVMVRREPEAAPAMVLISEETLSFAEKRGSRWEILSRFDNKQEEMLNATQVPHPHPDSLMFWVDCRAKAPLRLSLHKNLKDKHINHFQYDTSYGLPDGQVGCLVLKNQLFFLHDDAVYRLEKGRFVADNELYKLLKINKKEPIQNIVAAEDNSQWVRFKSGKVWYYSADLQTRDTMALSGNNIDSDFFVMADSNGVYWIGSNSGILRFDSRFPQNYQQPFNVMVRSVKLANDSLLFGGSYLTEDYFKSKNAQNFLVQPNNFKPTLSYEHNAITFEFAAIYYENPEQNQYSWKLEGFDENWYKWTSENKFSYTNLHEGTYTFKVKAKNKYGVESSVSSYTFTISPPFYRTIIAYILYAILVGLAIHLSFKYYTRKLREENEKLEQIITERTKEISQKRDEILLKNNELQQQKEEIMAQSENLKEMNEELNQTNEELQTTMEVIAQQKTEIENKSHELMASINYAKRIQNSMLPSKELLETAFTPENIFVLFKPRDVVSGDFYFFEEVGNKQVIAVADCTGHGVPGAFMSMIGIQILSEIIMQSHHLSPDLMLNQLHHEIRRTLRQNENKESSDGMDISLVVIHKNKYTLQPEMIEFAGAMNALYYVQDGEFCEVKADKKSIGGQSYLEENVRLFTKQTLNFSEAKSFSIYMCSDGYQDQFGGAKSRKFMTKNLKVLLAQIAPKPMQEQQQILEATLRAWMGTKDEQTDDITVMGIKLK